MPRRISANRRLPVRSSRTTSSVHRSPSRSTARATEQNWPRLMVRIPYHTAAPGHGTLTDMPTGLELMRAIATGAAPQAPISATLDFVLVAVDDGLARFEGTPRPAFDNPMATTHGGWAA